jgi:hypothetical protein
MRINWKKGKIECCGLHEVCERNLPKNPDGKRRLPCQIEYYDDDELDVFAGREANSYNDAEKAMFREILDTMLPEDVAGWQQSLELRGIAAPDNLFV